RVSDVESGALRSDLPATVLREALGLWRVEPPIHFGGYVTHELRAELVRLEELWHACQELALQRDLENGRHREVLGEIERLAATYAARDGLVWLRMQALWRCGRHGDALKVFREAHGRLPAAALAPDSRLQKL